MREDIQLVIRDLKWACRQPLYNGIAGRPRSPLSNDNQQRLPVRNISGSPLGGARPAAKRRREEEKPKSWNVILERANELLPFMTNHEHGQVSKMTGILLLGFLLPHSTGNEFFSLQHRSTQQHVSRKVIPTQSTGIQTSEKVSLHNDDEQRILSMSLEERLESSAHRYGNDVGELDDCIVHQHSDTAFHSFLGSALRPFLEGRPSHASEVDLLHILAMAIHPHPSNQSVQQANSRLEDAQSPIWEATKGLMASLVPQSFHIQHRHRIEIVQIVVESLLLPESQGASTAPLFEGAIPHLRASLYAFGIAAMNPYHSHLAQCGMVALAIQGGIEDVVKEEWSRLLHRMVDDQTNYDTNHASYSSHNKESFSPHNARGDLLRSFLIRYNQARHCAKDSFLLYALSSLTDAIEMKVDSWTKEPENGTEKDTEATSTMTTTSEPPLVLASLVGAAKDMFHFLLPIENAVQHSSNDNDSEGDLEESAESDHRDMLISCGIQLVHHWDPLIVREACAMLVVAFSYAEEMWEDYIGAIYDSVVVAVEIAVKTEIQKKSPIVAPIEGLVSAFSQRSTAFAVNLFRLLMKTEKSLEGNSVFLFRLMAAVAHACPSAAEEHKDEFSNQFKNIQNPMITKQLLAILMCCRKTYFFSKEQKSTTTVLSLTSDLSLGYWDKYLLSRHAMLTGNFSVAKSLYKDLVENGSSSQRSFLWLSAIGLVADGEAGLCADAAIALPESTSKLRMAISTFRSLQTMEHTSVSFQIEYLDMRVSFLDLLMNLRQLTMEMRFVGTEPKKFTRSNLHLKNIVRVLRKLSFDYLKFYKMYGLFVCQQSRSVLRTLHALCFFVSRAAGRIFLGTIPKDDDFKNTKIADGDRSQPVTLLMKHLDSLALEKLNQSVDAKIRAAIFLQIADGLLKTPVPIPRSLMQPKFVQCSSIQIVPDPDTNMNFQGYIARPEVTIRPGAPAVFVASGKIPAPIIEHSDIPFQIVILRCTMTMRGDTLDSASSWKAVQSIVIETSMTSRGTFFATIETEMIMEEGSYDLRIGLGCKDIRGGEWELPLEQTPCISIKITRATVSK